MTDDTQRLIEFLTLPPHAVLEGDCLERVRRLPDDSIDAIVTDPPYGLGKEPDALAMLSDWLGSGHHDVRGSGFMGKAWDAFVPQPELWRECLRVLKPGGHLLAFAGTRTHDLMTLGLRIAGFEIRDTIMWVYGSGFPKSLDVSKAIDKLDGSATQRSNQLRFTEWMRGAGLTAGRIDEITGTSMGGHYTTAASQPAVATREHLEMLRPHLGVEVPEWVERLVDNRTVESENFKRREVVGVEKMPCRKTARPVSHAAQGIEDPVPDREVAITAPATDAARRWEGWGTALKPALEPITVARKPLVGTVAANVLAHGTGAINIDGCRVGTEVRVNPSAGNKPGGASLNMSSAGMPADAPPREAVGRWPANLVHDGSDGVLAGFPAQAGTGSAARFFYCAKASKADRDEGLEGFDLRVAGGMSGRADGSMGSVTLGRNTHPTVKPTALMRWLVRLVTPPGGLVLDPFAGSGSTGKACKLEGFRFIGCELDPEYAAIARARIEGASE